MLAEEARGAVGFDLAARAHYQIRRSAPDSCASALFVSDSPSKQYLGSRTYLRHLNHARSAAKRRAYSMERMSMALEHVGENVLDQSKGTDG